jgi:hypothetical protein
LFDRLLIPTVEDALSGFEQGGFAKSFEAHRETFKKYKELKEKVEENQKILVEMDKVVSSAAKLQNKQQDYENVQSEAKAYWRLAGLHQEEQSDKLLQAQEQIKQLEERMRLCKQKKDSLHIAQLEQEAAAIGEKLALVDEDLQNAREQLQEITQHYFSLRLAEYKQKWKQAEEHMKYISVQLAELGNTREEEELQAAWESNGGQIRYLFMNLERSWIEQELAIKADQANLSERKQVEEQQKNEHELHEQDLAKLINEKSATIETRERDREQIRKSILANPETESIEGKLSEWIQRSQLLDDNHVKLTQRNKELTNNRVKHKEELNSIDTDLKHKYEQLTSSRNKQTTYHEAHQTIIQELSTVRASWGRITFIYDKQSSITEQLRSDLDKLGKEKESILHRERLAFRYIDDYLDQDIFFADSYVSELIVKWKNQFSLLESGLSYLQKLEQVETANIHPLWSITLITTKEEIGQLTSKLQNYTDKIQYPIQVMSSQEAARFVQNEASLSTAERVWLEPKHWKDNAAADAFELFKQSIGQMGEEIRLQRMAKEDELKRLEQIKQAFERFISAYSLETVQDIEQECRKKQEDSHQLEYRQEQLRKSMDDIDQESAMNHNTMTDQKDEMNILQQWIEKGQSYLEYGREMNILTGQVNHHQEESKALINKINNRKRALQSIEQEWVKQEDRLKELDLQRRSIQNQELYMKVKGSTPIASEQSLEWLKHEREDLYLKLRQISQSRQELEQSYRFHQELKNTLETDMSRLRSEQDVLTEEMEFPPNGEGQMEQLQRDKKRQEGICSQLQDEYNRTDKAYYSLRAKIEHTKEQYSKDHFGLEPIVFRTSLRDSDERIREEEKQLAAEHRSLCKLESQIKVQISHIDAVIQYLNQYKLMHGFENPLVKALQLTQQIQTDFSYDSMTIAKRTINVLVLNMEALQKEETLVKKAKSQFIEFCRKQIRDVKLRETAAQGIERRDSYPELESFQRTMNTQIEKVNHIAEETMRTHNQQFEQFIVHVHGHLKLIAAELRDIPNKTRVKIDDQWKPIYTFAIPEWDEHEGKNNLRHHMEWILDQLEKDKYRSDNGELLHTQIRKDLDKWFDTKQLLQILLQEKQMKVSCRKVTNENNVTKASYSWEQSNNWSGGEKWSKNMSLFLGLLNYVAEKRQHIQQNRKRHRTVILDNPFGKASSDHVLSPVFFIAEQLGFQIIALTAHAGGKFLKDYFPIVFSCRLRNAANSDKQVMTKEKEINQAYFRDNEPVALERLGDVKQIELFM